MKTLIILLSLFTFQGLKSIVYTKEFGKVKYRLEYDMADTTYLPRGDAKIVFYRLINNQKIIVATSFNDKIVATDEKYIQIVK